MRNKVGAANDGDFSGIRRVQFNSSDSRAKSKRPDSKTCLHTRSCPATKIGTGKIQFPGYQVTGLSDSSVSSSKVQKVRCPMNKRTCQIQVAVQPVEQKLPESRLYELLLFCRTDLSTN